MKSRSTIETRQDAYEKLCNELERARSMDEQAIADAISGLVFFRVSPEGKTHTELVIAYAKELARRIVGK